MTQLLYLGPPDLADFVRQRLGAGFTVHVATDEAAADAVLPTCDAILDAYMKVPFPQTRLEQAERLRVVVTATTGADHIDDEALAARGIPLLTLRGQTEVLRDVTAAAEHSWLLLMAVARQLIPAARAVRAGDWDRNQFPGLMLRGRTIGIVGCGRIGQWMGRYAEAFGMRRLGFDPHLDPWPGHIERVPLETLLTEADAVSVHVPLGDATRGLLDRDAFATMKAGVIVVNTSRGEVIDEAALLVGLTSGHVAGAGLDVLQGEPDVAGHPLRRYAETHDNLIVTPHIGGFSPDAVKHVLRFCCKRLDAFFGAAP